MAREVIDHTEGSGEWAAEPVKVESRPSGSQVVSVRLPTDVAQRLFEQASRQGVRVSELVRQIVERYLSSTEAVAVLRATGGAPGLPFRVMTPMSDYRAENTNLVVEEPRMVVALGFEETA